MLPGPADEFGRGYQKPERAESSSSKNRPPQVLKKKTLRRSKSGKGWSKILHPVARLSDGTLVDIADDSSPPYFCVESRHPMTAVNGHTANFFRHINGENCETDLHKLTKEYICQGLNRWFSGESEYLMRYECPRCQRYVQDLPPITGKSAEVERQILGSIFPDVVVYDENGEPTTDIEVYVHADLSRSKKEKLVVAGITTLIVTPSEESLRTLGKYFEAYVAFPRDQIQCGGCDQDDLAEQERLRKIEADAIEVEKQRSLVSSQLLETVEPETSAPPQEPATPIGRLNWKDLATAGLVAFAVGKEVKELFEASSKPATPKRKKAAPAKGGSSTARNRKSKSTGKRSSPIRSRAGASRKGVQSRSGGSGTRRR